MQKKITLTTLAIAMAATSYLPSAHALEGGDLIARIGAVQVAPSGMSGTAAVPSLKVEADDNTQLGLTASYMLSSNMAAGVLAATPFKHTVTADLSALNLGNVESVETKQLPPTVTFQYHFDATDTVKPFVGAGINYTQFFQEKATATFEGAAGKTGVSLKDSWGLALEAGVDIEIADGWYANLHTWYIDIETDATLDTANLGKVEIKNIKIDPLVVMLGIGKKF